MRNKEVKILFTILISMVCTKALAYDIAVENADGYTIYYNYFNDGKELEVAGGILDDKKAIVIPEEVTYMNRKRKVTSIGVRAFAYGEIESILFPNSLMYIQREAFSLCENLTNMVIPNNVVSIGEQAFRGCSHLSSLNLPNSVTIIDKSAFDNCYRLETVAFGNGITKIGDGAFQNCSKIKKVIIQDIAAWCRIEFGNYIANPVLISHHIYSDENNEITNLIIPNGVTSIGKQAFAFCEALTSLTIPHGVVSIGEQAFNGCKGISSVTIPSSVSSIGDKAFDNADIATVVSLIDNPFSIKGKGLDNYRTFSINTFNNAVLYVPKGTISKYKATDGWKDFMYIEEGDGNGNNPTSNVCEKPTISYQNGKLSFRCATDGVTFQSSITDTDINTYSSSEVQLGVTYNISVYATKAGYENSETATATLCWIDVEPKTDGIENGIAHVRANAILIQTDNGQINIAGTNDGTKIYVYGIDGQQVGSSMSYDGQAKINTNLQSGSIAIVKIGDRSIKVVIQ